MSEFCTSVMPAGAVECLKKIGKAEYMIVDDLSVSFADNADFVNQATNKAFVNETLLSYIFKIADYETGTADPNILTLDNTRNIITNKPIPNGTVFADMSFCDQQALLKTLKGGTYRVRYITKDGDIYAYQLSSGVKKGFKAEITALTKGIPQKSDIDKNVTIYVNHVSYDEFENAVVGSPSWNPGLELVEATPVGLNMALASVYTAGDVSVQVNTRCSDGLTGLVTADFEVVESTVVSPTIVAVEVGLGVYTLTIQKDGPVDLAAGDSVTFRVKKGTPVGFVSGNVNLTV
jgi:hypothetical protein